MASVEKTIEFTHFDLRDYDKILRNEDKLDDTKLLSLYKLLSPEHLLKLPFANDSNSLDKRFYGELLHIIGLDETKDGGKKVIQRFEKGKRFSGSLLENAITQIDSLDKISRLEKPSQYGETNEERQFNIGLELCITWINRILFLKLLEAQLRSYHKGDESYNFLSSNKIHDYDDMNTLFFQVLAKKYDERSPEINAEFGRVPYLNSSLFEPTEIEHSTLFISNLRDDKILPLYAGTVLKDEKGKTRKGEITAIQYLFEFLNAYDFSSEGSEEIQEDNKTLINASVLGLIFEKINGYKDGSFFTPGFITMYMCRETIRRAVVQKFNEEEKWECQEFSELYNKITDSKRANEIVNSIKICDPAVGSGHFLVSALNEMLAVKHDLEILQDREGKRLKNYTFEVVNDELIVTDEEGELFQYNPKNKESQRLQETLFHEKQDIIENCLFGVDINPNSVKICRLRLWIELLKNAYYKNATELETLPNIDINIKCGNSLISRFDLDADLGKALKKSSWTIDSYRIAVDTYRNAGSKEEKREMEKLIATIKSDFRSEISFNDKKMVTLRDRQGKLTKLTTQTTLFEQTPKEKKAWKTDVEKLTTEITKFETEIEEIKSNKIYENAFEWRFEFPEVLDDEGKFVGFDVVIGNPPYMDMREINQGQIAYYKLKYRTASNRVNLFPLFIELSSFLSKEKSLCSIIVPRNIIRSNEYNLIRKFILEYNNIEELLSFKLGVFEDVTSEVVILILNKNRSVNHSVRVFNFNTIIEHLNSPSLIPQQVFENSLGSRFNIYLNFDKICILQKISDETVLLGSISETLQGIIAGNEKEFVSNEKYDDNFKPILRGRDLKKYIIERKEIEFINYSDSGNLLTRSRKIESFEVTKKILTQHVASKIVALIDFELNYYMQTINGTIINNNDYSYEYILSLLNSKLFNFFYDNSFNLGAEFTTAVAIENLNLLPIKVLDSTSQKPFITLVDRILAAKAKDPSADTSSLESEIDQLVYQLYGLTEEEIAIVEKS